MREILFRGKMADNVEGEWVEGFYVIIASENYCIFTGKIVLTQGGIGYEYFKVDSETVGQYTGLTDKNGTNVFEGDIVKYCKEYGEEAREIGIVYWCDGAFWVESVQDKDDVGLLGVRVDYQLEVIGNIHDNPELLEESNE